MLLIKNSKEKVQDAIFYSYTHHINGFAAYLEVEEAMKVSGRACLRFLFRCCALREKVLFNHCFLFLWLEYPGVLSVIPNRGYTLHTTHSWEFLGLERDGRVPKQSLWRKARFGEDTIIANLDTGITVRFCFLLFTTIFFLRRKFGSLSSFHIDSSVSVTFSWNNKLSLSYWWVLLPSV